MGSKKKIKEKLIDPAVIGVENLLASCSKTATVTRVVLTGTVLTASCDFRASYKDKNFTVTPEMWEETTSEKTIPYVYSKVVQEKRAEEIAAAQSQWTLVSLLIAGTFGPPCSGKGDGVSTMVMKHTLKGLFFPACPPMGFPMHDIRDCAVYHTHAMLAPGAAGRYIPPMRYVKFMEFANSLKKDTRTNMVMLPFFTFPSIPFKAVFGLAAPILGIDGAFAKRFWGTNVTFDVSKAKKDLDLDTFETILTKDSCVTMCVDMVVAFKKCKIRAFSSSLSRY